MQTSNYYVEQTPSCSPLACIWCKMSLKSSDFISTSVEATPISQLETFAAQIPNYSCV